MSTDVRNVVAIIAADPHFGTADVQDLERLGQPVLFIRLDRARAGQRGTIEPLDLPLLSAPIGAAVVSAMLRKPRRVLGFVMRLMGAFVTTPAAATRALLTLPAAVYLADLLPRSGITHVHGSDGVASTVACIIAELTNIGFSFATAGHGEPLRRRKLARSRFVVSGLEASPQTILDLLQRHGATAVPAQLSALAPFWSRLGGTRIGIRWSSARLDATAAEITIADGERTRTVFAKQHRERPAPIKPAAERAAQEYRTLQWLHERLGERTLTVPRVLLFDAEAAVVLMERAPGKPLDSFFAAVAGGRMTVEQLAAGVTRAGAWLAAMQRATRRDVDGRALLARTMSAAVDNAATVASMDRGFRRHHRRIVARMRALEERIHAEGLVVTGHHGDFWPGNIFIEEDQVTVIDWDGFRDGLPLEDIAYFFIRVEMLRRRFRLKLPSVEHWFFSGYSGGQTADVDALELFTLTKGLTTLANQTGGNLPLPQRLWTRRMIRNAVLRSRP